MVVNGLWSLVDDEWWDGSWRKTVYALLLLLRRRVEALVAGELGVGTLKVDARPGGLGGGLDGVGAVRGLKPKDVDRGAVRGAVDDGVGPGVGLVGLAVVGGDVESLAQSTRASGLEADLGRHGRVRDGNSKQCSKHNKKDLRVHDLGEGRYHTSQSFPSDSTTQLPHSTLHTTTTTTHHIDVVAKKKYSGACRQAFHDGKKKDCLPPPPPLHTPS